MYYNITGHEIGQFELLAQFLLKPNPASRNQNVSREFVLYLRNFANFLLKIV